jgi:hypothetical protein
MNIADDPGEYEDIEHLRIVGEDAHTSPPSVHCVALP